MGGGGGGGGGGVENIIGKTQIQRLPSLYKAN